MPQRSSSINLHERRRRVAAGLLAAVAGITVGGAPASHADTCTGFFAQFLSSCMPPTTAPPATVPPTTTPPVTVPPAPPAATPAPAASAPAHPPAGVDTGGAAQLLDLVNGERAKAGLGALFMRSDIVSIALGHTKDMASQQHLYHNDNLFTSVVRSSLGAGALGENVDMDFSISAAHAALMASPHHRANILDARFTAAGFAVVIDGAGDYWTTEDFAQVKGMSAAAVAKPTAVAAPPRRSPPGTHPAAAPTIPVPPSTAPAQSATTAATAAPTTELTVPFTPEAATPLRVPIKQSGIPVLPGVLLLGVIGLAGIGLLTGRFGLRGTPLSPS